MLGFRSLASRPLASGPIPAAVTPDVVEHQVYGGWLPIKYLDRNGQEANLDEAPAQIKKDLTAERDTDAQEAIKRSVKELLAQVMKQRAMEDNRRAIAYLDNMAQEIQAAEIEAERLRWISDPRVIATENENALAVLKFDNESDAEVLDVAVRVMTKALSAI